MAVTYKKLFHLLIDKGMTNAELMEKAGFSANIITRIKRDNYISLDSIEKICYALNCPFVGQGSFPWLSADWMRPFIP